MTDATPPNSAPDERPLPPEVAAAYASPEERQAATHAWRAAGLLKDAGWSGAELESVGRDTWARIEAATAAPTPLAPDRAPRPRARARLRWIGAAVALAGCVLLAVGLYLYARPLTYVAPPGSVATHALPDGSTVTLNARSSLTYRRPLPGRARAATLSGEAFFEVAPSGTPFAVVTFNAEVRVLGTRFNVAAWAEESAPITEVVLEEGRVAVRRLGAPSAPVVLPPGHATRVGSVLPSAPEPVDVGPRIAWRRGGFELVDAPLSDYLRQLERRFGVRIDATDPGLLAARLTFRVGPRPTIEAYLDDLRAEGLAQYTHTDSGYVLSPMP